MSTEDHDPSQDEQELLERELFEPGGPLEPQEETALEPAGDVLPVPHASSSVKSSAVIFAVSFLVLGLSIDIIVFGWFRYRLPGWVYLTILLAFTVLGGCYGYFMVRVGGKRTPSSLEASVPATTGYVWVSEKTLYSLRHHLNVDINLPRGSDHRIHIVTRRHKMYLAKQLLAPALVTFVYLVLSGWLAAVTDIENHTSSPVWILVLLVLSVWAVLRYHKWADWFFVMTDQNIYLITQHPVWLWWIPDKAPTAHIADLKSAFYEDQRIGKVVGYGRARFNVQGELDNSYFNSIEYVPHAEEVAKRARLLIQADGYQVPTTDND